MTRRTIRVLAMLGTVLVWPASAFAHTGTGATVGFAHGLGHPVSGLDHVLAMVTVGLLAWQLGGRALWAVPAAFVGLMAAGGAIGLAGVGIPFVEAGIGLSVVVLGGAVALGLRMPVVVAALLAGFFALFHGQAHAAEMPSNVGGLAYAAGFLLATAGLHAAGIGLGLSRLAGPTAPAARGAGALVSLAGVGLLLGLV